MGAGVVLPALLALPGRGSPTALAALASIVLGNFLVRWAIVMLPHRDLAIGGIFARDGSP